MEMKSTLYPSLEPLNASAPNAYDNLPEGQNTKRPEGGVETAHTFTLHKINEILKILKAERYKRSSLAKKYQRGINVLTRLSYGCEAAKIGLGTAGVALLTTVIATPVVIAMEAVALGTGATSVMFNLVCDKVLSIKARKQIRIMMLAESKINTISDHISKALKDKHVSDEFSLILSELTKFSQMKDEIRTKTKIDDETKQSLIKQGKEQAVEPFLRTCSEKRIENRTRKRTRNRIKISR
jgi:hypothetical protein